MRIVSELPGIAGDAPVHRIGGADLCDLFGITPGALTGLVKRGIAVKLGHDAYDLTASTRAYLEHLRGTASGRGGEEQVLTLTGERARLARAQAEAAELKNAQTRGELVKADQVVTEWRGILTDLRAELLALPSRIGTRLPHMTPTDISIIDRELRDILDALSKGKSDDD